MDFILALIPRIKCNKSYFKSMNTHKAITENTPQTKILSISFNQDQGCFAISHERGFLVYNSNPFDLRVKRNFSNSSNTGSGIGIATMLHRTNYLALVGGGRNPKFPNNKLIIWDDLKKRSSLTLEFMSPILNVLLSRIRIVVVLKNQVIVYGFSSPPKKLATYETIENDLGLAYLSANLVQPSSGVDLRSISPHTSKLTDDDANHQILAFPGRSVGQIQLVDVSPSGQEKNVVSIIKAHKSKIRCLVLNRSGTLIASASDTGTIIRVHSTHNTALIYEFRRGLDRALISSMRFSHNDTRLAVLSDKNTLHVFNVMPEVILNESNEYLPPTIDSPENRRHMLRNIPSPIPLPKYFKSVWSFCSVNTNKYHSETEGEHSSDKGVIGWSGNDSIIIVWQNKRIWEKYVILKKNKKLDGDSGNQKVHRVWEIVRFGWKSLDI